MFSVTMDFPLVRSTATASVDMMAAFVGREEESYASLAVGGEDGRDVARGVGAAPVALQPRYADLVGISLYALLDTD